MGRIHIIEESTADERLKRLYHEIRKARGGVANVLKIHSLLPQTMEDHFRLYKTLLFESRTTGIRRRLLEMIAVVVSTANGCEYCVTHHSEPLSKILKDDSLLTTIKNLDWPALESQLKPNTLHVLKVAEKITRSPAKISDKDIQIMKDLGYSDEQILQIVLVISYFNFVNRNVLALGVELEQNFVTSCS